ncbi:GTP-binding protein [candidate division GN15 bacterium]|uniref:GTP-binding protein n=1 Tax=candidate division GN15 bacterium TaxID=2072418 RepID=A0A855X3E6_9BACT|nr:MAG: GTP-binding protein [candidate division GN15 bacterium]
MPANLPPQYYELERAFKDEKDPHEKLRLAQELLRIMPKHKGTDKLQADMKAKISQLKKQCDEGGQQHGARKAPAHDHIEREGAGQVILIGAPNVGKSSLLESLTHAKPLVADYPYTTREPLTGMMTYETIQIQLIDTPPISDEMYEPYMANLIRNADIVALVCDTTDKDCLSRVDFVLQTLEQKHIILRPDLSHQSDDPRNYTKRTIVCAHKAFEDDSAAGTAVVRGRFDGYTVLETSVLDDASLNQFKKAVFDSLGIIRVYTKHIGHEVALVDPVILPSGSTVEDAAISIHKDFGANLKFAKIWGQGKFDGQRVQRDFQLSDGDVIEFHI